MTANQKLFNQASLAEAAYASFIDSNGNVIKTTDDIKTALKVIENNPFTETPAAEFAAKYRVVSHIPNTASGFSATVFQDSAGNRHLAIRGTEFDDSAQSEADAEPIETSLRDWKEAIVAKMLTAKKTIFHAPTLDFSGWIAFFCFAFLPSLTLPNMPLTAINAPN